MLGSFHQHGVIHVSRRRVFVRARKLRLPSGARCFTTLRDAAVLLIFPPLSQRVRTSDRAGTSTDLPVLNVTFIGELRAL
jgi:hypothetical protein